MSHVVKYANDTNNKINFLRAKFWNMYEYVPPVRSDSAHRYALFRPFVRRPKLKMVMQIRNGFIVWQIWDLRNANMVNCLKQMFAEAARPRVRCIFWSALKIVRAAGFWFIRVSFSFVRAHTEKVQASVKKFAVWEKHIKRQRNGGTAMSKCLCKLSGTLATCSSSGSSATNAKWKTLKVKDNNNAGCSSESCHCHKFHTQLSLYINFFHIFDFIAGASCVRVCRL